MVSTFLYALSCVWPVGDVHKTHLQASTGSVCVRWCVHACVRSSPAFVIWGERRHTGLPSAGQNFVDIFSTLRAGLGRHEIMHRRPGKGQSRAQKFVIRQQEASWHNTQRAAINNNHARSEWLGLAESGRLRAGVRRPGALDKARVQILDRDWNPGEKINAARLVKVIWDTTGRLQGSRRRVAGWRTLHDLEGGERGAERERGGENSRSWKRKSRGNCSWRRWRKYLLVEDWIKRWRSCEGLPLHLNH